MENVHEQSGMLRIWLQAFRLQFVPTSIFPAVLGSVIAWATVREFNYWYFVMVIIGVTLHHIALNMADDVFDYIHAVDRSYGRQKNPYTGGERSFNGETSIGWSNAGGDGFLLFPGDDHSHLPDYSGRLAYCDLCRHRFVFFRFLQYAAHTIRLSWFRRAESPH